MDFTIQGKKIRIYGKAQADVPAVYLNTVHGEGKDVWQECQRVGCPEFTLVEISDIRWEHDMSPWPIPPIAKSDTPCTGGAGDYLLVLTGKILPAVEKVLGGKPTYSALAGYSLAGLFAVYALYHADVFARVASVSGSFWFPKFTDYVRGHQMQRIPERMYFSLGDREARTKNPYLSSVEEKTKLLCEYYSRKGIPAAFVMNPGNHFQNSNRRMADGILWILDENHLHKRGVETDEDIN